MAYLADLGSWFRKPKESRGPLGSHFADNSSPTTADPKGRGSPSRSPSGLGSSHLRHQEIHAHPLQTLVPLPLRPAHVESHRFSGTRGKHLGLRSNLVAPYMLLEPLGFRNLALLFPLPDSHPALRLSPLKTNPVTSHLGQRALVLPLTSAQTIPWGLYPARALPPAPSR